MVLLQRALRDLVAIPFHERRMIGQHIDKLAMDALPRGVEAIQGRFRDHLRLRIGRFRLLYRVLEGELTVVAVLSD